MIVEENKCKCEKPEPVGPFVYGAFQKCAKCGKVANWKDFEEYEQHLRTE
jgi:disulfide oxidoreductase YuzD